MQEYDLIVIGGGPGGYLCAERAGKAGLRTALIEKRALGGTCLNEGCIPTKSLLYCAKQYQAALHGADYGVTAQNVSIDHAQVVARKDGVVKTLVRGVGAAMKAHGVTVFEAEGRILGKSGERFEIAASEAILSHPDLCLRPVPAPWFRRFGRTGRTGFRFCHDEPRIAFPFRAAGVPCLHRRRRDWAGNGLLFRIHRHKGDGH